jgi:hypothetical protein
MKVINTDMLGLRTMQVTDRTLCGLMNARFCSSTARQLGAPVQQLLVIPSLGLKAVQTQS